MKRLAIAIAATFALTGCIGTLEIVHQGECLTPNTYRHNIYVRADLSGAEATSWSITSNSGAVFAAGATAGDNEWIVSTTSDLTAASKSVTITVKDNTGAQSTKNKVVYNPCD